MSKNNTNLRDLIKLKAENQNKILNGNLLTTRVNTSKNKTVSVCPPPDGNPDRCRKKYIKRVRVDGNRCLRPNDCYNISIKGRSGVRVVQSESDPSTAFVSLSLFGDYVVDKCSVGCGGSEFTSLNSALNAAIISNTSDLINIVVKQGFYDEGVFEIDTPPNKHINFISATVGARPGTIISGNIRSKGNVNWYGFQFVGQNSEYVINDETNDDKIDNFRNCLFTDNFRFRAENDVLSFTSCNFDYTDSLVSSEMFEILPGNGRIECIDCIFNINRKGNSNVDKFFSIATDNQDTVSRFNECIFNLQVQGNADFYLFSLSGTQSVSIMNTSVYIENSTSTVYVIGHERSQQNIDITIKTFYLNVNINSPKAQVSLIRNLWSPRSINGIHYPIIIEGCTIKNARLLAYETNVNNLQSDIYIINTQVFVGGNGAAIDLELSENNIFNLFINSSIFVTNVLNMEVMRTSGSSSNIVNLSITDLLFDYYLSTNAPTLDWGTNTSCEVNIFYSAVNTSGYTTKYNNATTVTALANTITI